MLSFLIRLLYDLAFCRCLLLKLAEKREFESTQYLLVQYSFYWLNVLYVPSKYISTYHNCGPHGMMLDGPCVIIRLSELLSIQRILFILDHELKHPLKKKITSYIHFHDYQIWLTGILFSFCWLVSAQLSFLIIRSTKKPCCKSHWIHWYDDWLFASQCTSAKRTICRWFSCWWNFTELFPFSVCYKLTPQIWLNRGGREHSCFLGITFGFCHHRCCYIRW